MTADPARASDDEFAEVDTDEATFDAMMDVADPAEPAMSVVTARAVVRGRSIPGSR